MDCYRVPLEGTPPEVFLFFAHPSPRRLRGATLMHKKHDKDVNDSLVSRSIDYFDHHGDKWHRALAYYYRGAVRHYAMHRVPEAIKDLKMVEGLSEGLDDWQLKSRIDEQLAFTNYYSQNAVLALEYSQKFMRDAKMLNDSSMVVRAHQMAAGSYELLDVTDSAFVYLLRGLQWIDGANELARRDMMEAVADMYKQQKAYQRAEQYLKDEVLSASNKVSGYVTLADIRMAQGRMDEAESAPPSAACAQESKGGRGRSPICHRGRRRDRNGSDCGRR